jgi:hypothetical protein
MTDERSNRLGLRGRLAHFESGLRLLGGANATGAIAAGVAYHAFAASPDFQSWVKVSALLFLLGIFTFVIAYMGWFITTLEIDHALHTADEPVWPNYPFLTPSKTAEEYQSDAKKTFIMMGLAGLVSFIFFLAGLASVLLTAVHLQFGSN